MQFKKFMKNWKLNLLAILCIALLFSLGCWQLTRSTQKKELLKSFAGRSLQTPLKVKNLQQEQDLRFYQAELTGRFDNAHTILLDNKIFHGQIGYEIYTPFYASGLTAPILIDRGFIGIHRSRTERPAIQAIAGRVTMKGMLNLPPKYVALGEITDGKPAWPLRVEYIHLAELSKLMKIPQLFKYVLILPPKNGTYEVEWQVTTITPERHLGYAVQWFALALTLLILSVVLNFRSFTTQK